MYTGRFHTRPILLIYVIYEFNFFFFISFFLRAYLLNDLHAFKHDCYCYVRVVRHRDTNLSLLRKSICTDGRLQFFQNGVRGVRAQIEIRSNSVWVYKNNFGRRQSFWVRKRWRSRRRVQSTIAKIRILMTLSSCYKAAVRVFARPVTIYL